MPRSETRMPEHVSKVAVVAGLGVGVAILMLNKSKKTARREKNLICILCGRKMYT